ncbi:MAG: DUF455 family protein [Polyangiales bacterium]|nr:DUF455 family protein [Myxococcales bacterium]MCB9661176.1 DUF455 family protein [Sandaracinaceae bacterium]
MTAARPSPAEPAPDVETWALRYIESDALAYKQAPPPPPATFSGTVSRVPTRPGRPPELRVVQQGQKRRGLRNPRARAELLHTFWHHELQAAELMCWALLRFPEAPLEFRRGLLGICLDEVRHMGLYAAHIDALGAALGDFGVRDWFWERVPRVSSPAGFVAFVGMGLEAGNLEHAGRFAARFRDVGDEPGAAVQERVGSEEVAHVRFATHWFEVFTGHGDFETWRAHLPPPISPVLLRGLPLDRHRRRRAGMDDAFMDALEAFQPSLLPPGSA